MILTWIQWDKTKRREVAENLRKEKSKLIDKEEELIVASNGNRNSDSLLLVDHQNYGRINIFDLINILEKKYNQGLENLDQMDQAGDNSKTENKSLRSSLNNLEFRLRKLPEKWLILSKKLEVMLAT